MGDGGVLGQARPAHRVRREIDRRIEQRGVGDLRYYNGETHEGVFALPNFVRELTATAERSRIVPERRAASAK